MSSGQLEREFLDVDVDAVLVENGVPGCSLAVLNAGVVAFARGYGSSRVTSGTAMTGDTRLQACSMSKPVAVLAALRLVDRGVLDLGADVTDYLTRWILPANGDWRPRITLRHLMSHTAGLTTHTGYPGYPRDGSMPTLEDVLSGRHPANAPGARVDLLPGVLFRYSGAGTSMLQLILEEATGSSAAQLLAELVLRPCGMRQSTFVQEPDEPDSDRRAHGYLADGTPVPGGWRLHPEQCAGGLWTTPADYLRLLSEVRRAYAGQDGALVRRSTARAMLTPQAVLPSGRDLIGSDHIGLGFFLTAPDEEPSWFGHTGSNTGFVCASVASVQGGEGAVIMFNGDGGVPAARSVLQSIARTRGWSDLPLASVAPLEHAESATSWAGIYDAPNGARVELLDAPGGVELTIEQQPPILLQHDGPTKLATERLDLRVITDSVGSVVLDHGGQQARLRRRGWGERR